MSGSRGIIVPLHKKGDPNDVNHYRGITLVSSFFLKCFTSILNKRVNDWVENNNIVSDAQFGLRKGRSSVDAILVLNAVIQKILNEKKRLYCAFIDLKKAFDSINLHNVWYKLFKQGLNGKNITLNKIYV